MEKTKLGLPVGLFGAFAIAAVGFGGYVATALVVGYVLLMEENTWLKKAVVKAAATMVFFDFLIALVGLIPDAADWVVSLINVFGADIYGNFVSDIFNLVCRVLSICEDIIFIGLIFKALNQGTIAIPFVDGLVEKNM